LLGPNVDGLPPPHGIELMAGNPPWIKVGWNDAPLLDEFEPLLGVRGTKSAGYNKERSGVLKNIAARLEYKRLLEIAVGLSSFLNDRILYPHLAGVQTNLYRNFIEMSWHILSHNGICGMLHPEGVYDDPKGGLLRAEYYRRLKGHYQFKNEFRLFKDIGNRVSFSINIFCGTPSEIQFSAIFNLFAPSTIDACRLVKSHNSPLPGIKDDQNAWETAGHPDRVITVTKDILALAQLFEESDRPISESRLLQVHGRPILSVLEKVSNRKLRLGSLAGSYHATEMFHESNSQRDGTITRAERPTYQPANMEGLVLSGPLFQIATPWAKSPNTICVTQRAYFDVDLSEIDDGFVPKSVYRPGNSAGSLQAFYAAIDEFPKPSLPGFWHVSDDERDVWAQICGEELQFYSLGPDISGTSSARQFAFFIEADGPVLEAIRWMRKQGLSANTLEYARKYSDVRIRQGVPSEGQLRMLPRPLTSYYRHVHRRQCQTSNVRSLFSTIIPPGVTHINPVISMCHLDEWTCLNCEGVFCSIVGDFVVRAGGKSDIYESTLRGVPFIERNSTFSNALVNRVLRLVSVTDHYASLWERNVTDAIRADGWAYNDPRLAHEHELPWCDLPAKWERGCALRSDFARRQAALESDVLVALALNLTVDELLTIYRVQFAVMRQYENADQYDAKGRRLPNTVRKDAGAKELREALKTYNGAVPLAVSWKVDNGRATVTKAYYPPFTRVDREDDYRRAWMSFAARFGAY
jgi:hypothetical protein